MIDLVMSILWICMASMGLLLMRDARRLRQEQKRLHDQALTDLRFLVEDVKAAHLLLNAAHQALAPLPGPLYQNLAARITAYFQESEALWEQYNQERPAD